MTEQDEVDLKNEIQHIFDSGANENRIFEMVKMFIDWRYTDTISTNKTTKRLLTASRLGINFDYGDGHRWINFYEEEVTDNETMYQKLERNNIHPDLKVYGNLIDCLDYVDSLLTRMGQPTLEKMFDKFNDWGFSDEFNNW